MVGVIIGTVSTGLLLLLVVVIMFRRSRSKEADESSAHLTAEEEALIVKKLGQIQKPNNLKINGYASGHAVTTKPLNNATYSTPKDRRHDAMIKNKLSPKANPPNPHIKIHNNLRSTGTEI